MVFPALDNSVSVYNWISLSKHVCTEVFTLQRAGFTPRCVSQISNKKNIYTYGFPRDYRIQIHCDSQFFLSKCDSQFLEKWLLNNGLLLLWPHMALEAEISSKSLRQGLRLAHQGTAVKYEMFKTFWSWHVIVKQ